MPATPTPFHLIRSHHAPISSVYYSRDNTKLYAGDQDGYISITDLKTRRVVAYWKAHDDGILGLEEWDGSLISQGRDNLIHFYEPFTKTLKSSLRPTSTPSERPTISHSITTNSLNFCRFSLAPCRSSTPVKGKTLGKGKGKEQEVLIVVPSLLDSETADIYHIPSFRRVHSSINYIPKVSSASETTSNRSGLIMSSHLAFTTSVASVPTLRLLMGFEDGRVELWSCESGNGDTEADFWRTPWDGRNEAAGSSRRWNIVWSGRKHNEAVMAMTVNRNFTKAFTVSADHFLCRYDLDIIDDPSSDIISSYSVKQIGNASLALNPEGSVIAVGGWDGKIRIFSTATFKPLGVLEYHRETVHVLSFANPPLSIQESQEEHLTEEKSLADTEELGVDSDGDDDGEDGDGVGGARGRWFVSGGKDTRLALWSLMDFNA